MDTRGETRSLWDATAPPAPATPRIEASRTADVAIVGGGYAGLSAALHLAQDGAAAVVLEAARPGWGASGRNGGQVIPGLKHDPEELVAMFGPEAGERLVDFMGRTADCVFGLVDKHGIACDPVRKGWLQPAHSAAALATVQRRAEQWQRRGAPVEVLDRATMASRLGTDRYLGGSIDRRAGALQPLSYARGLARAAIEAGAAVHGQSRVAKLARGGGRWQVATHHGPVVTADRVLVCTNGYSDDLWPGLGETVIAANSFQIATRPLPERLGASILPDGPVASDTRTLLRYFRRDASGRFIMGGRGPFREPRGPGDYGHLRRAVTDLYPELHVEYEFYWSGRVALTRDHLPHLHEPAPGLIASLGCNGRGVGLATALGVLLADYVLRPERTTLPLPITPLRPIPLHRLHRLYVSALIGWYRLRDAWPS
jgi:glycine/D-amino acid oxidase-like deaminating enzyme